jgi:hypothetical protein
MHLKRTICGRVEGGEWGRPKVKSRYYWQGVNDAGEAVEERNQVGKKYLGFRG